LKPPWRGERTLRDDFAIRRTLREFEDLEAWPFSSNGHF
jgi:hypothetical protein